uniref:BED-type domain-containing protein n=1 Tax=Globodera rostochiensis TaxID=31243 RepID=A0A914HIA4_GLORO
MMMDVSSTNALENDFDIDQLFNNSAGDEEGDGDAQVAMMGNEATSFSLPLFNGAGAVAGGGKRRRQRNFTSADELPMGTLDIDKPKHSYWRYFRRDRATARAECRMCGRSIQMGLKSSTGGMRRHMQSLHFGIFVEFIAERAAHPRGGAASQQQQQQQMALRKPKEWHDEEEGEEEEFGTPQIGIGAGGAKHFLDVDGCFAGLGASSVCSSSSATASYGVGSSRSVSNNNNNNKRLRHSIKTELLTPSALLSSADRHGLEVSLNQSLKVLLNHSVGEQYPNNGLMMREQEADNDTIRFPATSQERLHQMMASPTTSVSAVNVKTSTASSTSSLRAVTDAELIGRLQIARERLKDAMDMMDSLQHELTIRQQLRESDAVVYNENTNNNSNNNK